MGLVVLIPLSIAMGLVGLVAFCWALKNDQFEDPEGAAWRVLPSEDGFSDEKEIRRRP